MTVARDFELSPLKAANEVAAIIAVVNGWKAHFQSLVGIPDDRDRSFRRIVTDDSGLS
jgi:hypothetical protein